MLKELELKIKEANESYRIGKPIMSDKEYDILVDELTLLDPHNIILSEVGHTIQDVTRKRRLKIAMASMNKCKSLSELKNWSRLKNFNIDTEVVLTPKYDGLSLENDEINNQATTRGDGTFGQSSDEHFKLIQNQLKDVKFKNFTPDTLITYGEVMMFKKTFLDKYSSDFANPRNLVAGLLNSKDINGNLSDCHFIKYGLVTNNPPFENKSDILDWLNENQTIKVHFEVKKLSELTEEYLFGLFQDWSKDFEIDGIIVEINSIDLQNELGRETSSNNPCWARAYKSPDFEQCGESEVLDISWNISKQGLVKPIIRIKPIKLDGVTISNVTGNNAKFIKDMGIGKGAIIKIKRSGMVIPLVVDVIKTVEFEMPVFDNVELEWNESGIELITIGETDDQRLKQLISFFAILEADNVSEGVITQLWNAGYQNVKDILNIEKTDLEKIDRFGKRKATIVYNSIQKSIKDVELPKLQHASGLFKNLGSKKLALVEIENPTFNELVQIDGFSDISANSYLDGLPKFDKFIKDLPITISKKVEVVQDGDDFEGMVVVYTGIRDKNSEEVIVSRGGKIGSSISKNTTHLICKDPNSGSSKLEKAKSLGVKIITIEDFNILFKKSN